MSGYRIRKATKQDRIAVRRLVWRARINPFGLHWQNFVVAVEGNRIVGCGQLKPHGTGTIELASLAVVEDARGRGIARAIIERLTAAAPRPLYLMCLPGLLKLYERFGFTAVAPDSAERLPPHFIRISRFARVIRAIRRARAPIIMRLR